MFAVIAALHILGFAMFILFAADYRLHPRINAQLEAIAFATSGSGAVTQIWRTKTSRSAPTC